jgi:hypothetical protein
VSGAPTTPVVIGLRLTKIGQLFNSLDPSPFHEKDLDADAEEYIIESARESGDRPVRLVVELPVDEAKAETADRIGQAIRHYFAYRLDVDRRRLRLQFRRGWISLAIGLAFLAACLGGRQLLMSAGEGTVIEIIAEGLLIAGWVAMWRPIEIFLYDWWPIAGTCRILRRLAAVEVERRASTGPVS